MGIPERRVTLRKDEDALKDTIDSRERPALMGNAGLQRAHFRVSFHARQGGSIPPVSHKPEADRQWHSVRGFLDACVTSFSWQSGKTLDGVDRHALITEHSITVSAAAL